MTRLSEIDAFVSVVEAGGFSAAAPRLGLTPSAVSKLISRLEGRLGVRLLQRTTRQVRPTAEGEAYYRRASRVLEELREAEAELGMGSSAPRELLRVNCSVGLGQAQLAKLVPEFLLRYPEIRLELALEDRTVDLVGEGFDIAVRFGRMQDSALMTRRLGSVSRRIFAAPSYIARAGMPRTPRDLATHNCLNFSATIWLNRWPLLEEDHGADAAAAAPSPNAREVEVSGNFVGNNGELLYLMALEGVGIMRLADFMVADDLAAGRLVPLLDAFDPRDAVPLYLVWPPQRFEPPRLRAFIDFMVEKFTPAPPWEQARTARA